MLLGLVHQVSDTIARLDPIEDAPAFVDAWLARRPELREAAFPEEVDPAARETLFQMFAAGALTIIKRMPEMMEVMLERLHSTETDPAVQCAVATVLAYVVQPRDLIPDDTPGGYGYVDDAIVLHAGFLDILSLEPPHAERFRTQQEYLAFVGSFAPPEVIPELQQSVETMEMTLSVFRMLPAEALELTTQIIVDDPLRVTSISGAKTADFQSSQMLDQAGEVEVLQYATRAGETIVVRFPGGGGVASDGKDIYRI